MKIPNYSEEEFKQLLKALVKDLLNAGHYNRLHNNLSNAISQYEREMNRSPYFWRLTLDAHIQASLLHLCRAYDREKNSHSLSLAKLLKIIKENTYLFDIKNFKERLKNNPYVDDLAKTPRQPTEEQIKQDLDYVSDRTNPIVKKLIKLRGNYLAHKGLKKVLADRNDSDALTCGEFEELINKGLEIFNRYLYLFESATQYPQPMEEDDYQYVLKSLAIRQKTQDFIYQVNQIQILNKDNPDRIKAAIEKFKQEIDLIIYPNLSS